MELRLELRSTGGTTTGFLVPDDVVASLGGGGRPKVVVTVDGYSYRSSIARMGGEYWLGVSSAHRTAAGIAAGDVLDLVVELDTAPREVEVPEDLAAAIAADPQAAATWAGLSHSNRRYHAEQVAGAKAADTRARRVAKAVAALHEVRAR